MVNFDNLGFDVTKVNKNYQAIHDGTSWGEGKLKSDDNLTISAFSTCLHYAQEVFEGLKAYKTERGTIQLFRIDENAKRFNDSCRRALIPEVPEEMFIDAVRKTVLANREFVPPRQTNGTLYIRPYAIGIGYNLGLKPAKKYLFGVLVTPVGSYFESGINPAPFMITDYDRAAPRGTGHVKMGSNYAAGLMPNAIAHKHGYADCIYLDSETHTKIDEVGAANFFGITKDGRFITPESPSILPSITRRSLMTLAEDKLGMPASCEEISLEDLRQLAEAGACGTAAVITPISKIDYEDRTYTFYSETEVGPTTKKLYDLLTGIQYGDIDDPYGWITVV